MSSGSLVIEPRAPDTTFTEACYWLITADANTFKRTAEIWINLEWGQSA